MFTLTHEEVWDLCHSVYLQHGRRITLPANTDPTKTYQWRYVVLLTNKFKEWKFDKRMAVRFLHIVLEYAKERKLMHKGLALHFQKNMLDLCFKKLNDELEVCQSDIWELERSVKWVMGVADDKDELLKTMVRQENYGGHSNLTKWYLAGKLSDLYLALSKTAWRALRQLPSDEQERLPSEASLWLTRLAFLENTENRRSAQELLQGDLKNVKHIHCAK